ncbi:MAG: metallophosphoesterase [Ramlibacter sp.]|nr:metallophosphoesterase [Ramlibacter sp.]MBX3659816.1 metallophosphoesterase [Ramlibacter sp.]
MPLYLISALLHAYVGWRLLPALGAWPVAQGLLLLLLLASAGLMPMGLGGRRGARGRWAERRVLAGLLFMGLFSSLFVLTVLRDGLLLLSVIVFAWRPAALPVGPLREWTAVTVPLLGLLATVLGFWNARRTAAVVRVDVPLANLPAGLHGFTVAQISDIHVGPTIKHGYLSAIVARVNSLGADMVAITGDLVDGRVPELADHVAPLAQLRSRHGSYFVTGNHEYYSGAHAWIDELRRLGVQVLMNEHVVLRHGPPDRTVDEAALLVAGVADYSAHQFDPAHRSDPQGALRGAPAHAGVRLLLAHQPRSAVAAARAGFDLQLSGHTHGGQFWPWNLFVRLQQPFTAGLHRLGDLWVYTSRGTGYWGPPKRFGAPSEITLLRLVPAA